MKEAAFEMLLEELSGNESHFQARRKSSQKENMGNSKLSSSILLKYMV